MQHSTLGLVASFVVPVVHAVLAVPAVPAVPVVHVVPVVPVVLVVICEPALGAGHVELVPFAAAIVTAVPDLTSLVAEP